MEDKILSWKVVFWYDPPQQTITYLKLATEALEQGVAAIQD